MTDTKNWTAHFPANVVEFTDSWREDKYKAEVPFADWLAGDNGFYKVSSIALDYGLDPCELGYGWFPDCYEWLLPIRVMAGDELIGTVYLDDCYGWPRIDNDIISQIRQKLSENADFYDLNITTAPADFAKHPELLENYELQLRECMNPEYRQSFVDWREQQKRKGFKK